MNLVVSFEAEPGRMNQNRNSELDREVAVEMWDMDGSKALFLKRQWEYLHCLFVWKCQAFKAVQTMLAQPHAHRAVLNVEGSTVTSCQILQAWWPMNTSVSRMHIHRAAEHWAAFMFICFLRVQDQHWLVVLNQKAWLIISFVYWFPRRTRNQAEVSDITVERDKVSMEQERWQHGPRMQTEHTAWGHSGHAFHHTSSPLA